MPENNAVSGSSEVPVEKLQESIVKIKIDDTNNEGEGGALPHSNHHSVKEREAVVQDSRGVPDCIYFLRHGICGYGSNCRYNHPDHAGQEHMARGELPERVGQPDCQHFLRTGSCKYGYTCKYNHPKNRLHEGQLSYNSYGLPMRQEEKSCPYYMKTGYCKFGISCKFNHPQPASTHETVYHVPGSSGYAPLGSSTTSPSGLPLVGGIPAWSPTPYMSNPPINGLSSYMPIVYPPLHGIIPGQHGLNAYMGTINPITSTGAMGAGPISNSSHIQYGFSTHILFPERPDQPDCQYYMKNGSCKYGSSCKYHHPRDRITSSAACTIGPLGLPLRPGQAVCGFYSSYGTCKYGLGCKFDHPLTGYYNYGAASSYPVFDPSVQIPYQRNSSVIWTPSDVPNSKTLKLTSGVSRSEETIINVESVDSSLSEEVPQKICSSRITSSDAPQVTESI